MKMGLAFLLLFSMFITNCKQDVDFQSTESSEHVEEVPDEPGSDQGPRVVFLKTPEDHRLGKSTLAVFKVIQGAVEIKRVDCLINGFGIRCDWLKGLVPLLKFPTGKHELEVVAIDENGRKGQAVEDWNVFQGFEKVEEAFQVEEQSNQTDILFVIDNSSSMRAEQKEMSKRFGKFINQLKNLNWQIGITTTDPRSNRDWGDGRLDPFQEDLYYLTPRLGEKKAQDLFAAKVQRKESGYDFEEGIRATYRALQRSMDPQYKGDRALADFFREKSALAVVLVSDEDESDDEKENLGSELIKLVHKKWGSNKVFQFNSIITYTRECLRGDGKAMGYSYAKLSKDTNGIVGDICAKNYSQLLKDIGQGVADLVKVQKLSCVPQDMDKDGKVDLKVNFLGSGKLPGYAIDQDKLVFDETLKPGSYELEYYCLDI